LWDVQTGTRLRTLQGHEKPITVTAISPDNKMAATGSDDTTVRFWDVKTGSLLRTLRGHLAGLVSLAFSPDGKTIAITSANFITKLLDVQSGALLHIFTGNGPRSSGSGAFSPDSRLIVTWSDDGTTRLWDVQSGILLHTLPPGYFMVIDTVFSPDGRAVLINSQDRIRLWDVQSGLVVHTWRSSGAGNITSAVFSADGQSVITGDRDGSVLIWDTRTGDLVRPLCPLLIPDDSLLAGLGKALCVLSALVVGIVVVRNQSRPKQ